MTPRRRSRSNEKLPPYVYKRRGCYVIGEYDPGTQKVKYSRLCADDATINDLWNAYNARDQKAEDSIAWIGQKFIQSEQFTKLAKSTRDNYQYGKDVAEDLKLKKGGTLGDLPLNKWSSALVQKVIDKIAKQRGPTSARHVASYLKRLFRWGKNRGYAKSNPAKGIELPKERKRQRLPSDKAYNAVLAFVQEGAKRKPRTKGSQPPYLWIIMEFTYLLRQRGIEAVTLTDAHKSKEGVLVNRRKGSRDNVTKWNPRLKAAWEAAEQYRNHWVERKSLPTPMKAENRFLFITSGGSPLNKSSLDSAWQRMITTAIKENVITEEDRFSLHDLKRMGVTNTKGTRAEKQEASGHKSEQVLDTYDKSVPVVDAADE